MTLLKKISFPFYVRITHGVSALHYYHYLKSSQWLDRAKIKSVQTEKLKILQYNLRDNSFYKHYLSDLNANINDIDDIKSWEIINKSDLRIHHDNIFTGSVNAIYGETSGSSGTPLQFYVSKKSNNWRVASYWRFLGWHGINPWDNCLLIWGGKLDEDSNQNKKVSTLKKLIKRIKGLFLKEEYRINIFLLNTNSIKDYFPELLKFGPTYIRAYKSAVIQFAELAIKTNLNLKDLKIKLIIVTSEILEKSEKLYLEDAFGCIVANEYGASEIGQMAYECTHKNLHINEEFIHLWTNDDNEVRVTNLENEVFPFINYEIGDRIIFAEPEFECTCGRKLKVIEKIEGRISEYIVRPDGQKLSQYIFYYIMEELNDIGLTNAVDKFQVIQKLNLFTIFIVKGKGFSDKVLTYIEEKSKHRIDPSIDIKFKFVENIQREPNGKILFFKRV